MAIEFNGEFSIEDNVMFFYQLPSDIILEIFTRLTPSDSLRCMQVCRAWYNLIPQYAKGAWSTMQLYGSRRSILKNRVWLQFLGKHVKHVTLTRFREKNLYTILQLLIKHGCLNIQRITFKKCSTAKQETFLPLLRQLGTYITELKLEQHVSNSSFDYVFQTCPNLKRFKFDASTHAYTLHQVYSNDPVISMVAPAQRLQQQHHFFDHQTGQYQFEQLTDLNLYCGMDFQFRLEPLLKKCPNLRSFRLCASLHTTHRGRSRNGAMPNDLDMVLYWCPKLVYFDIYTDYFRNDDGRVDINDYLRKYVFDPLYDSYQCRYTEKNNNRITASTTQQRQSSLATTDSTLGNLQYFSTYGLNKYDPIKLSPVFNRHAPSLKHLVLGYIGQITDIFNPNNTPTLLETGWSSIFRNFSLQVAPHLQTLVLEGIPFQRNVIIALETMLNHCSSLETLVIRSTSLVLINFSQFFEQYWSHIRYLELDRVNMILGHDDDDSVQLTPQQQQQQQFNIREIRLIRASNITFNLLTSMISFPCPSLKRIDAVLHPERSSESDMCQFARMLGQNASELERLRIANVRIMPPAFFKGLCNISTLCRFSTYATSSGPIRVDAAGFTQMLDKCASLKTVVMDRVKFNATVSRDFEIISKNINYFTEQQLDTDFNYNFNDVFREHPFLNNTFYEAQRPYFHSGGLYLNRY
ncbi:hypothetical protein BDA99DRAFT_543531 [Phascolomyces articulosus]|uniref:F-box domain-containing protein n=1 Tax=Phascolomyces articulosus TaxID=60185 RepID=A0AAD5P863_9FUNG|nr:hypothetical protein BDA99DRAFT_543531 [Phascolomyces articulosus]